jgi:hypothetical protein
MSTTLRVPLLVGIPQVFSITLGSVTYKLTLVYRNDPAGGWVIDIDDSAGNPILHGVPMVTGANLLAQHKHLGFNGGLYVQSTSSPNAVPSFASLGADANLYWVSNP